MPDIDGGNYGIQSDYSKNIGRLAHSKPKTIWCLIQITMSISI